MNKVAALAFVVAAMSALSSAWAFQSQQAQSVTAGTTVGGTKVARFTLAIKDTANPLGADAPSISWTGVSAGDSWTIAKQLLVINSTVTDNNGGIQIYTDNTSVSAVPRFVDPTPTNATNPDSAAGGLLEGNVAGNTSVRLPMAWSIKSSSKVVDGANPATAIGAADPNTGPTTGSNYRFQWLFVSDKANTAGIDFNQDGDVTDPTDGAPFVNGDIFLSMVRSNGIHFEQGPTAIEPLADGQNAYVYFQANFTSAAAQQAYQTNRLFVEAFIQ